MKSRTNRYLIIKAIIEIKDVKYAIIPDKTGKVLGHNNITVSRQNHSIWN